jgi:hypothetical protein
MSCVTARDNGWCVFTTDEGVALTPEAGWGSVAVCGNGDTAVCIAVSENHYLQIYNKWGQHTQLLKTVEYGLASVLWGWSRKTDAGDFTQCFVQCGDSNTPKNSLIIHNNTSMIRTSDARFTLRTFRKPPS